MASNDMPELGSKISLISKADIRYEGKLFTVDPEECTIALSNVRSFGTEDRVTDVPVPPQNQAYDYILFRASDIKDICVVPNQQILYDPAIVQVNDPAIVQLSAPPSIAPTSSRFGGKASFSHPVLGTIGDQLKMGQQSSSGSGFNPLHSGINPPLYKSNQGVMSLGGGSEGSNSVAELLGNAPRSLTPGPHKTEQGTQASQNPMSLLPQRHLQQNKQMSSQKDHPNQQQQQQQQQRQQQQQYNQQRSRRPMPQQMRNNNQDYRQQRVFSIQNSQRYHRDGMQQQQPLMQQRTRYPSGGGGMRGNYGGQQMMGGNQRGMRPRIGGYRTGGGQYNQMQQRGGRQNTGRVNRSDPRQNTKKPLTFDSDYDFDKANTEFEELRHSLNKVKISANPSNAEENNEPAAAPLGGADDKKDDSGNETAMGESDEVGDEVPAYNKSKSFFDSISCEAMERCKGRTPKSDWRKELKLNTETFGVAMNRRAGRGGRGRYSQRISWNMPAQFKSKQQPNLANLVANA